MGPSTIALLGALVAVAGGLVAVFASRSASRKRAAGSGGVAGGESAHDRSDPFDGGSDGGGGGD